MHYVAALCALHERPRGRRLHGLLHRLYTMRSSMAMSLANEQSTVLPNGVGHAGTAPEKAV